MPSLIDDAILLLLDTESGRPVVGMARCDVAIAGAAILALVRLGRVSFSGTARDVKWRRITVVDSAPTGEAVLDSALVKLARRPLPPQRAIGLLQRSTRRAALERLVERGILRRADTRPLGVFRVMRWSPVDAGRVDGLADRVSAALAEGGGPDERTADLVRIAHAADAVPRIVAGDRAALRERAGGIVEGDWLFTAVRAQYRGVVVAAVVTAGVAAAMVAGVAVD